MTDPDKAQEQHLIQQAKSGSAEAFGELVVRHQATVFNIAYRFTNNRQEAEDVAQEAFVKTYRALDRFDPQYPFGPWLYRIATNTALNWVKRKRPIPMPDQHVPQDNGSLSPEAQAIANERAQQLRAAIFDLPPNYRAVIELRHFQGLSYKEMSNALNEPLSTIKSWLFRARRKLKKAIKLEDVA